MVILGLGGLLDDAAACVLKDGKLLAAVEQRKVVRMPVPGEVPDAAVNECLRIAGLQAGHVDAVALARPFSNDAGTGLHMEIRALFPRARLEVFDHHVAHAASAFHASGFAEATVVTLDQFGDFQCGARWRADSAGLQPGSSLHYPDSAGEIYSRATEFLGYEPGADEHKVQWMSATSDDESLTPVFARALRDSTSYVEATRQGNGGFSARFYAELGLEDGAAPPAEMHPRIAKGLQKAVEDFVLEFAGAGGGNLCLAGGLFFNAFLVASLERSGRWSNVFVQPAAGNAGTALGAAMAAWKKPVAGGNYCLGPEFSSEDIKRVIENCKLRFRFLTTTDELIESAVRLLGDNRIVAWMQGRMEFGPRALGNRSILASPLNPYSTENLNVFIKHREPFRKFAASVPAELAAEYFDAGGNARFLATMSRVKAAHRKTFEPAILGEDWIRVHTVSREDNPLYHRLLLAAGEATGLPVVYNTSFNLFGDPLVCTPRDAVRSFYSSGIDALLAGQFLVEK